MVDAELEASTWYARYLERNMCQDWLREVTWLIQHWLEKEEGPRQFGSIDRIRERRFELIDTFGM